MIVITPGSHRTISTEVLVRSLATLSQYQLSKITLIHNKKTVLKELKSLGLTISFEKINFIDIDTKNIVINSLIHASKILTPKDLLLTMPANKEDFQYQGQTFAGHTEFFRYFYASRSIAMIFYSPTTIMPLLSDHIPIDQVKNYLNTELIVEKTSTILEGISKTFSKSYLRVLFAGINPHCGENGVISDFDFKVFSSSIKILKNKYQKMEFLGPFAGDSLASFKTIDQATLNIFSYHDQGLSWFKRLYGMMAINVTLGLPFVRFSPDHGTAPNLYGKKIANITSCLFCLKTLLDIDEKNKY